MEPELRTRARMLALLAILFVPADRIVALDPWGHPYQYRSPVDHTPPYEIVSLGSDGREGGSGNAADISNVER